MKLIQFKLPSRYLYLDSSLRLLSNFNKDNTLCIRPAKVKKIMAYYMYANGDRFPWEVVFKLEKSL